MQLADRKLGCFIWKVLLLVLRIRIIFMRIRVRIWILLFTLMRIRILLHSYANMDTRTYPLVCFGSGSYHSFFSYLDHPMLQYPRRLLDHPMHQYPIRLPPFHFDADPVPDPASQNDADPSGSGSATLLMVLHCMWTVSVCWNISICWQRVVGRIVKDNFFFFRRSVLENLLYCCWKHSKQ
jgi:hypothetical protein